MSALVVGSVALDTVETPFGSVRNALGGTAVFFSIAASLFTHVQLVGAVGDDFPDAAVDLLLGRDVDLKGLQRLPGETFRWVGKYGSDMNVAHTLETRLNVLEGFRPTLPQSHRDVSSVFLGNIDPELQLDVLRQVGRSRFTALDTMDFWIERKREPLTQVISQVDAVLINEGEIRQYTGYQNVFQAALEIMKLGPHYVVVKRGEYGAIVMAHDDFFILPAFPTVHVRDTTGAGDSFAGGFVGYLDRCGQASWETVRAAALCGSVVASFAVEGFSVEGIRRCRLDLVAERCKQLAAATHIDSTFALMPTGVEPINDAVASCTAVQSSAAHAWLNGQFEDSQFQQM